MSSKPFAMPSVADAEETARAFGSNVGEAFKAVSGLNLPLPALSEVQAEYLKQATDLWNQSLQRLQAPHGGNGAKPAAKGKSALADRRFAGQFKRQTPVGRHIPDFVSFVHRLAIELVNANETETIATDRAARRAWLESRDYAVVDIRTGDVEADLARELVRLEAILPSRR